MTLHPHHHAATAHAWHLGLALAHLEQLAQAEAAAARTEWATVHDGVRSWQPSTGRSQGAHGDPVASAVTTAGSRPRLGLTLLHSNAVETLWWLLGQLDPTAVRRGRALEALTARIPRLQPSAAGELVRWLAERDQVVRDRTGRPADWRRVPHDWPCPACGERLLRLAPAGPEETWVVWCPGAAAGGVPHAWAWPEVRVGLPVAGRAA
ncbi:hypothetical protein AB0I61_17230 [Polymorphospora rubra]|uniref:hypothetical protein n=1 Tax=Polymorphospora rubra TaxID=338584 RepID=UPI0033EF3E65